MMKKSKGILFALILALLMCCAANAQEEFCQTIVDPENGITLGTLTAGGSMLGLTMKESDSTGYTWRAAEESGLTLVLDEVTSVSETEQMLGMPGNHSFIFTAGTAGQGEVSVWFAKNWLHGSPAVYTVRIPYTCAGGNLSIGSILVEKNQLIPSAV